MIWAPRIQHHILKSETILNTKVCPGGLSYRNEEVLQRESKMIYRNGEEHEESDLRFDICPYENVGRGDMWRGGLGIE